MSHFVIGITGGIGSGKTAVTDRFQSRGITVADADVASREVVQPGMPALAAIADHFGPEVISEDGTMVRAAVRKIVFADPDERKWLESVTVPAIMDKLRDILAKSGSPYSLLMLSSGTGQSPLIHRSLVVDVPPDVQVARVMSRDNNDEEQVRAIMAAQPSREIRLEYADDVIVNDGSLEQLDEAVQALHEQYLTMAAEHAN
ncbi:MAG: dephospho-CoA kinase [OM182 bacterium MED-G24]|uniref:Dephospho-CoA kinase n=1 Tax=OM182 bacterium MED-G24 TaxID=1986255 RepID=A0A2A5WLY8_9GAMM|nr:MAG: dephospho-CoA kinase [OM182 bacterium MED-G24]|tara:strand:- start:8128 stop:8733 length:606 start_codon:yes stop_codon:yes gene_type:complete